MARRRNHRPEEHVEDGSAGMNDINIAPVGVILILFIFWVLTFVDTEIGNARLLEGEEIVKTEELKKMQIVEDDEEIIRSEELKKMQVVEDDQQVIDNDKVVDLKQQIYDQQQRAEEAENLAAAFGVQMLGGDYTGTLFVIDLTINAAGRDAIESVVQKLKLGSIGVIGCGERFHATGSRLKAATPEYRKEVVAMLKNWPLARRRPLLDAVDQAEQFAGVTRVVLFTKGLPTGDSEELLRYVSREGMPPLNVIDCSGQDDPAIEEFFRRLSAVTKGSFQKLRRS